jgi:uncharacterized short protein YbdD (DUF466 family)
MKELKISEYEEYMEHMKNVISDLEEKEKNETIRKKLNDWIQGGM